MKELFKKGITRRLLSVVLALVMVFSLMPMNSLIVYAEDWQGPYTVDGVDYYYGDWINISGRNAACMIGHGTVAMNGRAIGDFEECLAAGHWKVAGTPLDGHELDCGMLYGPHYVIVQGASMFTCDEYMFINGCWEKLGQVKINSQYFPSGATPGDGVFYCNDGDYYLSCEVLSASTYTVTFDANGGTGEMSDVEEVSGSYTLPTCTFTAPAGKEFDGWALSAEGAKITDTDITVDADTTLYALWKVAAFTREEVIEKVTAVENSLISDEFGVSLFDRYGEFSGFMGLFPDFDAANAPTYIFKHIASEIGEINAICTVVFDGNEVASVTLSIGSGTEIFAPESESPSGTPMGEIESSVDIDVPVYAQVATSGSTYNVRFVYAIDKTAIDNLSEVGLVCELVGGEKLTMSGTEVFSTVMAGSTEISDPNKYYAVFEIKNVDVDSTFKVNTIVKSADDTTTEGSTVYSYTLTAN